MKINIYILPLLLLLTVVSCKKDDPKPEEQEKPQLIIGGVTDNNLYKVDMYANDSLFVGYNKLYLEIKQQSNNQSISSGSIKLKPLMDMDLSNPGTMKHTSPSEAPEDNVNEDNYFEGAVVFVMPSMSSTEWYLTVVADATAGKDSIKFTLPKIAHKKEPRLINIRKDMQSPPYFISIIEPSDPTVGINEFVVCAHKKESMMSFPAVETMKFNIEPRMPSMGHGSPNNEDPVHTSNGHYKGQVNFNMTGWWRINVDIYDGSTLISDTTYFDITF